MAVNTSLAGWFRSPSPGYSSLNSVQFADREYQGPTPVPQMPAPTGTRGGNTVANFSKTTKVIGQRAVLGASRVMMKF